MKKLTGYEFEHFLRAIVKKAILNESEFKRFEEIMFKASYWPHGEARDMALDFMATLDIMPFIAASRSFGFKAAKLNSETQIDEDSMLTFEGNLDLHLFKELGAQLLNNPEFGHKLLANFESKSTSSIEWLNMRHSSADTIAKHLEKTKAGDTRVILSNFPKLSKAINGFNPGRITLITAASGFGKTKLAINIALAFCKDGKSCRYFNMEMIEDDFVGMIIQKEARISSQSWADGSFITNDNLNLLNSFVQNPFENLFFTNGENLSSLSIIGSIYKHRPDVAIIDYDQKMIMEGADEWYAMLKTIEKLEDAAKVTNCHIIVLAQANDDGDLKSSKRSKQPASAVLNFYRDEMGCFIKSIKNRFEKPFCLELDYRPEISLISELDFKKETPTVIKKENQWSHLFPMK